MAILMVLAVGKVSSALTETVWPLDRSSIAMPKTPSICRSSLRIEDSSFCHSRTSFCGMSLSWAEAHGVVAQENATRTASKGFKKTSESGTDYTCMARSEKKPARQLGRSRQTEQRVRLKYRNYRSDMIAAAHYGTGACRKPSLGDRNAGNELVAASRGKRNSRKQCGGRANRVGPNGHSGTAGVACERRQGRRGRAFRSAGCVESARVGAVVRRDRADGVIGRLAQVGPRQRTPSHFFSKPSRSS